MSNTVALLVEARRALGFSQRELGKLLGVTERTVQRWDARRSDPGGIAMIRIATAVHPIDPALAARIAAHVGTTLEALGIAPAPAPRPGPEPAMMRALVDAVVCAAADTLSAPPATVRPVLASALRKAAELGLTMDDVLSVLSSPPPKPAPAPTPTRR